MTNIYCTTMFASTRNKRFLSEHCITMFESARKETCLVPIWRFSEDAHGEVAIGQSQKGREEDHVPLVAILGREVERRDEQEARQDGDHQALPVRQLQAFDQWYVPTNQI